MRLQRRSYDDGYLVARLRQVLRARAGRSLWVDAAVGAGATFYFTIPPARAGRA